MGSHAGTWEPETLIHDAQFSKTSIIQTYIFLTYLKIKEVK